MGAPTNPSWHGENELISEVDADWDEVTLLPSTRKSVKTLTRFSTSRRSPLPAIRRPP
jgi:hypothetical protein